MKKGLTELVVIIDKSGSMHGLEEDVVGGFNSLIEEQKTIEGDVLVTTILFNSRYYVIHDREDIKNINPLTKNNYKPNGCTALLDTMGDSITHMHSIYKELKEDAIPENVIFSIMTDGYENSSKKYTYPMIKKLIQESKENGWSFLFQAANIDSLEEGDKLGIDRDDISDFLANGEGVKISFCVGSSNIIRKRKKLNN